MVRTSYYRFDRIIKITRYMARLCGADIVKEDYKMSWLTWAIIIGVNLFFACTIYTIYQYLVIDGDWKAALPTLCILGGGVQGYSKLMSGLYRKHDVQTMLNHLYSIYKEYEQKDVAYEKVLNNCTDLTWKMCKIMLCVYIYSLCTVMVYPLIHWLLYGEKLFVMQFFVPGLDPNSEFGYTINTSFHVCLMTFGGLGNFAGDLYMFIFMINISLMKDILKVKFIKLNEIIVKTHDSKITLPLLSDIVQWHQYYNKYVLQVEDVFHAIIFIQIFTCVMSTCCTLFAMIIRSWPAAFAYLTFSTFTMYMYCALGHLVEVSNDDVTTTIYTDCMWYELTVPEQKLILLMLRISQQPRTLSVGHVMPLSMSTALQLTKCIYSYLMMLVKFLSGEGN